MIIIYIYILNNKDLLYSMWNHIQYLVIACNGKESEAERVRPTQYYKSAIVWIFLKKGLEYDRWECNAPLLLSTFMRIFKSVRILSGGPLKCSLPFVSKDGFSIFSNADIWGWTILCRGAVLGTAGCWAASLPPHHEMPPVVTPKIVSRCCPVSSQGQFTPAENSWGTISLHKFYLHLLGRKKRKIQHISCYPVWTWPGL